MKANAYGIILGLISLALGACAKMESPLEPQSSGTAESTQLDGALVNSYAHRLVASEIEKGTSSALTDPESLDDLVSLAESVYVRKPEVFVNPPETAELKRQLYDSSTGLDSGLSGPVQAVRRSLK